MTLKDYIRGYAALSDIKSQRNFFSTVPDEFFEEFVIEIYRLGLLDLEQIEMGGYPPLKAYRKLEESKQQEAVRVHELKVELEQKENSLKNREKALKEREDSLRKKEADLRRNEEEVRKEIALKVAELLEKEQALQEEEVRLRDLSNELAIDELFRSASRHEETFESEPVQQVRRNPTLDELNDKLDDLLGENRNEVSSNKYPSVGGELLKGAGITAAGLATGIALGIWKNTRKK